VLVGLAPQLLFAQSPHARLRTLPGAPEESADSPNTAYRRPTQPATRGYNVYWLGLFSPMGVNEMYARMLSLFYTVTVTSLAYIPFAYSGEAPTGFDNKTNGFISQTDFDAAMAVFNEVETIADGLGPIYNSDSCGQCHQSVVSGGSTQITELRSDSQSRHNGQRRRRVESPGGTIVEARAIDASIVEFVSPDDRAQALRISPNTLGDGFVEAVLDQTLLDIQQSTKRHEGAAA
jgi:hypothetical protein